MNPSAMLISLGRKAAASNSLDPSLLCAVVEQESSGNPWAIRYASRLFLRNKRAEARNSP
jgi:soluble lytic murein transglycosylase-like protein